MNWDVSNSNGSTSTPKRRRLGTTKICQNKLTPKRRQAPFSPKIASLIQPERCESPPLPCNQVEFLCDSRSDSSVCSEIPCSPGVLESALTDISNFESFIVSKGNNSSIKDVNNKNNIEEIDEAYDDLFNSKLEQELNKNQSLFIREKGHFDDVENTFNAFNETIMIKNNELSIMFETKDSFLLDIRESGIDTDNSKLNDTKSCTVLDNNLKDSFYGLPLMVKELFRSYRNIDKLYDWQEECLSLKSIRKRENLIYALPTSGGKTLVAEILMLREVINRKHNALFILPFVAIVQEKIWALSPFALQLDFLLEEYASGKGHIPPKKRRKKNSIYIATIEKALAFVRSLIEEDRLQELGLIVVDELHLLGEAGRGATLETLLSTVLFANKGIQIVGMSATIGNLPDLAKFLRADVFERKFRPIELTEYVKRGDMLYKIVHGESLEFMPDRQLCFDYSAAGSALDPDRLGGLVAEVAPRGRVLVFCPTQRNCENVARLLCQLQRREMLEHAVPERLSLVAALRAEGAAENLQFAARCGLAYHHAGLAADERVLLEHAFRSGVISVLCCTSTLAAGVNLPAQRVIIRAPLVGRAPMTLASYKQMVGRAGRAGQTDTGDSIVICTEREWAGLRRTLEGGVAAALSGLRGAPAEALVLSAVALRLVTTAANLHELLACTLLATQCNEIAEICEECIRSLLKKGAIKIKDPKQENVINEDTEFSISELGDAAIKGCMDLSSAAQLLADINLVSRGLVLLGPLHLLYLVTPHNTDGYRIDYRHYYSLYCSLDDEGTQTARALGITEMNAVRMMTGKPVINVPESAVRRFYLALVLRDLWREVPYSVVADKYMLSRGAVSTLACGASAAAACGERACGALRRWAVRPLLAELASQLRLCAAPELRPLMELPAVKKARAQQLVRGGFKRVEDVAKAKPQDLAAAVPHLGVRAASHLISAARIMLIEKVENLRAEAEEVMDELKMT
ncbi:helicase POLQ-like [Aricia agestis]|uniref:helicase POLQ-like n=1 Tax=Aricia agestis TaxID=91739 RepID=UPI001C2020AA|nr:helicase POLQ-like [Aricia agestis]